MSATPKNVGDYLRRGEVLVGWSTVAPTGFDYFRRGEPVLELETLITSTTVNVDTPGAIVWAGATIVLVITAVVAPGAITWAGQTVTLVSTQPAGGYQGEAGLPRFPGDNVLDKHLLRWP